MARLVRHFVEAPRPCSYLTGVQASLEYRLMVNVAPDELDTLLSRGWRRFGPAYFRPACRPCGECVSLRIDTAKFAPTLSQRRALKRTRRFRVEVGSPKVDAERLKLHALWHRTREDMRGWEPSALTEDEYATQFAFPSNTGRELAFYDGDQLVGLSLLDVTPRAVSAAYFFYHPDVARLSPGVGNVLRCLELAKDTRARHVYLGYRVQGCDSLHYKGLFRPHELLEGRPGLDETAVWKEMR